MHPRFRPLTGLLLLAFATVPASAGHASTRLLETPIPSGGPSPSEWSPIISPAGSQPGERLLHSMVYDPLGTRVVMFGGVNSGRVFEDLWTYRFGENGGWFPLPVSPGPSARRDHLSVYDSRRGRMLMFGGSNFFDSFKNDVWELSLGSSPAWSAIAPLGTPPSGRFSHTGIYDPVRDRLIVFGGYDGSFANDVWALRFTGTPNWVRVNAPGGPNGRDALTAIYDPVRDRMLLFGGWDGSQFKNDVWTLSLSGAPVWTHLAVAGSPPSPRRHYAAVYDPVVDRLIISGGFDFTYLNDTWALNLGGTPTWTSLHPAGDFPSTRNGHRAVYDPVQNQMVLFGGYGSDYLNDTWFLGLGGASAWTEDEEDPVLEPRRDHISVYDSKRGQMLTFGGSGFYDSFLNEVFSLSLGATPHLALIEPEGLLPPARFSHAGIYDPVRDRLVVFGGYGGAFLNDVWALGLSGTPSWTQILPSGVLPAARDALTALYDPVRDRMLLIGGWDGSQFRNDVWALNLSGAPVWTQLSVVGSPPSPRRHYAAVYDPVGDRVVLWGGLDFQLKFVNDTWALSLAGTPTWQKIETANAPKPRNGHRAVYDPLGQRMIVFGGYNGTYISDTWALSLAGAPEWTPIHSESAPPGRMLHTAICDEKRSRLVTLGGLNDVSAFNDVWQLGLVAEESESKSDAQIAPHSTGAEDGRVDFGFHGVSPNPSSGRIRLSFTLPDAAPANAAVYSPSGRLVLRREVGALGPGRHSVDLNLGSDLHAGVYLVRLIRENVSLSRKIILTP